MTLAGYFIHQVTTHFQISTDVNRTKSLLSVARMEDVINS